MARTPLLGAFGRLAVVHALAWRAGRDPAAVRGRLAARAESAARAHR